MTPPSGSRLPGEAVRACAERELAEETRLVLPLSETGLGSAEWAVYAAEAPVAADVRLDAEHDRFAWVSVEEAASRCLPAFVGKSFVAAGALLDGG